MYEGGLHKTSEFWGGLGTAVLAAVGGYLAQKHLVTTEQWNIIQSFIISGITYVVLRVTSKIVKR